MTSVQKKNLLEDVAEWSRGKQISVGSIVLSTLSCYLAIVPLALLQGAVGLFTNFKDNSIVIALSAIGCAVYASWPHRRFVPWIPALTLLVLQSLLVIRAKPPEEWIYALPSYLYSFGSPIIALVLMRFYCKQLGLLPQTGAPVIGTLSPAEA